MRTLLLALVVGGCDPAPADTDPDTRVDVGTDSETDTETDVDTGDVLLTDADGNTYATVRIGGQVWMAENLKVTSFNDGTPIPLWTFGEDWFDVADPAPWYQWGLTADLNDVYDDELPEDFYGAMYNDAVLASGRLAPSGWRIPTVADWQALEATLAADGRDASALRSTFGWHPASSNGTDDYGFDGLPSGYVSAGGSATGTPVIAKWATSQATAEARTVVDLAGSATLSYAENSVRIGAAVRLIREE